MNRLRPVLRIVVLAVVLLLVNLIADRYFRRVDLTKEKRYSLSEVTKQAVDTLSYPVYITSYLEGEFPAEIRNFQEAVRTTLMEMKQYAGAELQYTFEDPSRNAELLREFDARGYTAVPVREQVSATEARQKNMYPLVVMRHRGKEVYIDLLKGCAITTPMGPQADFAKAEADLEYKLTSALLSLTRERPGVIGLVRGHGELDNNEMRELGAELTNRYALVDYDMRGRYAGLSISNDIQALIILQPDSAFTEREKYELDQYLMRGGSIFWVFDQQRVDLDMYRKQSTVTELRKLNLDDFFMHYGVKVNYDLVQDLNCDKIEVVVPGNRVTFVERPWIFHPISLEKPAHPVTRNVDLTLARYASSIDTFPVAGLHYAPFLTSSERSRTIQGSQFIDIAEYLNNPPPENLFRQGPLTMGLLIEGEYQSLFSGRPQPVDAFSPNPPTAPFLASSRVRREGESEAEYRNRMSEQIQDRAIRERLLRLDNTRRMAILSDGSFPLGNEFRGEREFIPYDNKTLLMNVIDYLAGDIALTEIRSKDVVIRRLDAQKIARGKVAWQLLNVALPVLIVIIAGGIRWWLRRRRYARPMTE